MKRDAMNFALVSMQAATVTVLQPLQCDVTERDVRLVPQHATLWSLAPRGQFVCLVNGQYISRRQWWQPVRAGDVIVFIHIARGGGGESSPLRTLLQIGLLAATLAIPGAGFAVSLLRVGVGIVGNLLINALVPLPSQQAPGQPQAPSPTYSVGLQGNTPRLGQSIPVRYGQELVAPDYLGQPYSSFDPPGVGTGRDQYFQAVLGIGIGTYEILAIYIDDTDIRNFQDVSILLVGPEQFTGFGLPLGYSGVPNFSNAVSVADARVVSSAEVAGQDLVDSDWIGPFTVNRSRTAVDVIWWDVVMPRGIGYAETSGAISSRSVSFQTSIRAVNDAGQPTGLWTVLRNDTITGATTTAVRRSFESPVLPGGSGRYQLRMRRLSAKSDNQRELNDMQWVGLRAQLAIATGVPRTDITGLAVKIRANEQLSGLSQGRINVLVRRRIPIYSGGTWSAPTFTRNPAHIARDILHDTVYGRALPDDRIDHVTFDALAATFDARQDRCDYSFDRRVTTDDALRLVARTGRCIPILRRGAVYTMVRDESQPGPVAVFMPRNMASDSFSVDYLIPTEETPDAVRLTYRSGQTWAEAVVWGQLYGGTVYAYADGSRAGGVPAPLNVVEQQLPGVVGLNQALREAAFIVGDSYFRRTRLAWTTELEGLLPAYGSLVSVAHDVTAWGQSGDVVDWVAGTRVLAVTEPLVFAAGQNHYVRLQYTDGSVGEAILATAGADAYKMVLQVVPAQAPVFDRADRERTRYLFGALADVQRYARITGIAPGSEGSVQLSAALEDERVHTADAAWLPSGGVVQDPLSDGSQGASGDSGGGGGADVPVTISDGSYGAGGDGGFGPWNNQVVFNADGTASSSVFVGFDPAIAPWLAISPVTTGISGLYETRITYLGVTFNSYGGDLIVDGRVALIGTFDTWLAQSSNRSFGFSLNNDNANHLVRLVFRAEIRDVASGTVQDSATYTLSTTIIETGGGG